MVSDTVSTTVLQLKREEEKVMFRKAYAEPEYCSVFYGIAEFFRAAVRYKDETILFVTF